MTREEIENVKAGSIVCFANKYYYIVIKKYPKSYSAKAMVLTKNFYSNIGDTINIGLHEGDEVKLISV